jgi:hypothetical protein
MSHKVMAIDTGSDDREERTSMKTRWQDWVILISGVWLSFAPLWMAGYAVAGAAALNSTVIGVLLVAASWIALLRPRPWEEWVNLVLGTWLVVAPFALGFQDTGTVVINHVVIGLICAGDAMMALAGSRRDRLGASQHR